MSGKGMDALNPIPAQPAGLPADHPLLSLAMIVRDGGQNLACLLAGAHGWVDEIVIGDTGSQDGSPEVARSAGARVLDIPWQDDFSAARNAVLDACRGRWVLVLDADEEVDTAGWAALREWVRTAAADDRRVAGDLATRNYQREPHGRRGWTPNPVPDPHALPGGAPAPGFVVSRKVRVFPNLPRIRFRGKIHETVESSLWEARVRVEELPWPVHHFGYLASDPRKARRYLHLAHLKTTEQPHDAQAWAELAECALVLGDRRQALFAIERSLVLVPGHPDRRLTAGWLLMEAGRLADAEAHLAAVMGHPHAQNHLIAEAAHLRAQIFLRSDRLRCAGPLLAIAIRLFPDNGHFQNTLGSLNLALGQAGPARTAFERAATLLPSVAAPCLNLALMLEHAGAPGEAAAWRQEAERRATAGDDRVAAAPQASETPAILVG